MSQMTTRSAKPRSVAQAITFALAAGIVWSLVPWWMRGPDLADVPLLATGGAITMWLGLMTVIAATQNRQVALFVGTAGAALMLFGMGTGLLLEAKTHHRPLAAVTWMVCSLIAAVGTSIAALRWRWRHEWAAGWIGLVVALCLWALMPTLTGDVMVEALSGVVLLGSAFLGWVRAGPRLGRTWLGSASLVLAGSAAALSLGASERLHELAPIVAGPLGLLH